MKDTDLSAWDVTDLLRTDQDITDYLEAAFDTGEPDDVIHAISAVARARGLSATALQAGLARGTVVKALASDGNPTLSTLLSILKALNLSLSVKPSAAS
jgi:probable addiction module antidote protein